MSHNRYYYDSEKCTYESVEESSFKKYIRFGVLTCAVGLLITLVGVNFLPSLQVLQLKQQSEKLKVKLAAVDARITTFQETINALESKDLLVYRSITGLNDPQINLTAVGGAARFTNLNHSDHELLLRDLLIKLDELEAKMVMRTLSYDEIAGFINQRDALSKHIPAITPVFLWDTDVHISSGFGLRFHKIDEVHKFHEGLDFAGPINTSVYATGSGVIEEVRSNEDGYGNEIVIDHGYGYKSRYAHLSAFKVEKGQYIKRGQVIGLLGSTGKSTGPHVHYEVIYFGKAIDPEDYIFENISAEEYKKIISHNAEDIFDENK